MNETDAKERTQDWFFTFGHGQPNFGGYTKIHGTWLTAREEMIRRHGNVWSFQYESAEEAGVDKYDLVQVKE